MNGIRSVPSRVLAPAVSSHNVAIPCRRSIGETVIQSDCSLRISANCQLRISHPVRIAMSRGPSA